MAKRKKVVEPVVVFPRRYSGPRSEPFWHVINSLDGDDRKTLYLLGCALQDIEGRVMQLLTDAQERARG